MTRKKSIFKLVQFVIRVCRQVLPPLVTTRLSYHAALCEQHVDV